MIDILIKKYSENIKNIDELVLNGKNDDIANELIQQQVVYEKVISDLRKFSELAKNSDTSEKATELIPVVSKLLIDFLNALSMEDYKEMQFALIVKNYLRHKGYL